MQDVASSASPAAALDQLSRGSRTSEADHERGSKPTTATTGKHHTASRRNSFRPDLTVHPRTGTRRDKTHGYAAPASDRESWWRVTIKVGRTECFKIYIFSFFFTQDSPNPGTYDTHLNTFIKEIVARPMTYGFKSDGRRRDPQPLEPKGRDLLPGAYSVEDFAERYVQMHLMVAIARSNHLIECGGFHWPMASKVLNDRMYCANQWLATKIR